jgi:FKBP-type peptidyl-prolyl cis-trans isomerase SlyD
MKVASNTVVTIAYKLTSDTGEVIDQSRDGDDFAYLHGHQNIVPGLEKALEGKSAGESVETTVPPEEGYGTRDDHLVFRVPRSNMPDEELEVGMQFAAQDKEGNQQIVTLVEIGDGDVTLDANHPLAGENLNFAVTIQDVREASSEELEHGHVHGPGGHQH